MAKVRILLEAGQENAAAVGDIQGWEALYDYYALRNTSTTSGPSFSQGSYKDTFQLTGTFPGGWTADALGAEQIGEFQTANCAGVALQMVKQAVFYNPTPTFLTYDTSTSDYPGRFRLSGSSQLPHRITTDMLGQAGGIVKTLSTLVSGTFTAAAHGFEVGDYVTFGISAAGGVSGLIFGDRAYEVTAKDTDTFTVKEYPSGDAVTGSGTVTNIKVAQVFPITITRHRTNTTHTAVPGGVISRTDGSPFVLNVEPPLDPLPEAGEVFDHELVLMASTTKTGALTLNRQYGGDRDGGSDRESSTYLETRVGFEDRGADVPALLRLTTTASQIRPGMRLSGLKQGDGSSLSYTGIVHFNGDSDGTTNNASGAAQANWPETGTHSVVTLYDSQEHTIVNNEKVRFVTTGTLPSGGTSFSESTDYFALEVTQGATFYNQTGTGTIRLSSLLNTFQAGEAVRLTTSGSFPSGLDASTTYFVGTFGAGGGIYALYDTRAKALSGGIVNNINFTANGDAVTVRRTQSLRLQSAPDNGTALTWTNNGTGVHSIVRSVFTESSGAAHGLFTGQEVKTGSVVPAGLTTNTVFFAIVDSSTEWRLATSLANATAGSPVAIQITDTPASSTVTFSDDSVPSSLVSSMYVTRLAEAGESKTYAIGTGITAKSSNVLETSSNHLYVQDEKLRVTGASLPTGLTSGTDYFVQPVSATTFKLANIPEIQATVATSSANWTLNRKAVNLAVNDPIKASSTAAYVPGGFTPGTTYYVKTITTNSSGYVVLTLSAGVGTDAISVSGLPSGQVARLGGDTVTITAGTGSGDLTIERLDSHCSYYVADELGGEDLSTSNTDTIDNALAFTTTRMSQFSGYFNGLQLRCKSGTSANVGKSVLLKHVELDSSGSATVSKLHHASEWAATPTEGDKFVIEPPPVSGSAVPFDEFCKILPWSPFEGRSAGQGTPYAVTLASTNVITGVPAAGLSEFYKNAAVKFYTTGTLPNDLVPGKTYFLLTFDESTGQFTYSQTYGGTAVTHESVSTEHGSHFMVCVDALGKDNPFPPGFNYPGQFSIPEVYQHDRGPRRRPGVEISSGITTALRMSTFYGESILHINCAFPGSTIQHREIGTETGTGFGHYDPARQISWSKGEPDSCFARLEAVLAGVKRALDEQGDTGEVELITWLQGEEEAKSTTLSENYKANLRQLKKDIRAAVVSAGLSTKSSERIPFVQALIREKHTTPTNMDGDAVLRTSAAAVNTIIKAVADEDPHSRYVELTSVATNFEQDLGRAEYIRYSGVGMNNLGKSLFEAWESLQAEPAFSEVQICNLALSNLGDRGNITSFRTSDGSRQSDLCAKFYDLALNVVLQRHPWDFSIRRTSPTKATTDRTEWLYSFLLPDDFVGVLAVLPKDPRDDVSFMGRATPLEYAIELDANYTRRIYCNQDDIVLRYHARVTDPNFYSEMFVQALSWKLATLLAGPLIKGEAGVAAATRSQQLFEFYMQQATAFDATKTRERKLEEHHLAEFDRERGETGELADFDLYRMR